MGVGVVAEHEPEVGVAIAVVIAVGFIDSVGIVVGCAGIADHPDASGFGFSGTRRCHEKAVFVSGWLGLVFGTDRVMVSGLGG